MKPKQNKWVTPNQVIDAQLYACIENDTKVGVYRIKHLLSAIGLENLIRENQKLRDKLKSITSKEPRTRARHD